MRCKSCGNIKKNFETFYNLSLEVKNQKSIADGLKRYTSADTINDYNCGACNQKTDLEKKNTLSELPNTLIIHLQRITFNFDTLRNEKLNERIEFPNVLNMKQYLTNEILRRDEQQEKMLKRKSSMRKASQSQKHEDGKEDDSSQQIDSKVENEVIEINEAEMVGEESEEWDKNDDIPEEDCEYKLVGVCCHMGIADAGHYLSYINIERDRDNTERGQ
jgi:ubiquitin C-terminal hydrolase